MRRTTHPRTRGAVAVAAALALAGFAALTLIGCTPLDQPTTTTTGAVSSTGTVQADISAQPTPSPTPEATSPASVTPTTPPKPVVPTLWPAKVGTFARNFKKQAWFPKYVPKGYRIDTIDIVEMGTKTGLVCDIAYLNGDKAMLFTQGSPKQRSYAIVSTEKVPWGTSTADVMLQDPEDPSSPPIIVYSKGGTFIELQGDPSLAELKKVAASMVPVK